MQPRTDIPEEVVLIGDDRVAAVPIHDSGEQLVDCRNVLRVDGRRADSRGFHAHLRAGVVERLMVAEGRLPAGWRLLLIEGYRPPVLQQRIFEGYSAVLREAHPEWSDAEV